MTEAHLWHNGRVYTGRRFAEAMLVEGDRVVAVGPESEVRRQAPTGAERHDLAGRLLMPGLIDAHLHLADIARSRESFDARGIRSFELLVGRLSQWAAQHPEGPVVGGGWEAEQFDERSAPDRTVLDRVGGDRTVVLYHTSGHAAVVNSLALARAGIDRSTPDPPSGRLGRDRAGEPDGRLYEEAMRSVVRVVYAAFPPTPVALLRTLAEAAKFGVTTVATMNASREETRAVRSLLESPGLPIRVRVYVRLARIEEFTPSDLAPGGSEGRLAVPGAKTFADGAFGPRTAWLGEPYADAGGEVGLPIGTEEELAHELATAASRGLGIAVHAIGDRAIGRVLDRLPQPPHSNAPLARIEHAALTPPSLFGALARARPALVVQPGFLLSDTWLAERLGRPRARWAYAFRSLLSRGHLLAGSSDAPYDPFDPWRGLRASVRRTDDLGRSANPALAEALAPEEAFSLYTTGGARALGEGDLGRLDAGAWADFIVAEAPDVARAIGEGAGVVRETWVGGRPSYGPPRARESA